MAILNAALCMEYATIVQFPPFINSCQDEESAARLQWLVLDSLRHADMISKHIKRQGGEPEWTLKPLPQGEDFLGLLEYQKRLEMETRKLYEAALPLSDIPEMERDLNILVAAEQKHYLLLEDIIARLSR